MRRNRFEIAPQALLYAAGVVLTISLIGIMMLQFSNARVLSMAVNEKLTRTTKEISEADITKYDGMYIKGIDVTNYCRRHLGSEFVIILDYLQVGVSPQELSRDNVRLIRDSNSDLYINPIETWRCEVERNENEVITNIIFTKRI